WMSAWPRMHDRATEAAVAARASERHRHEKPSRPQARRRQSTPRHAVIQSAVANPPSPPAPVYAPSPAYPMEALREQRGGVVTLRVRVVGSCAVNGVSVAMYSSYQHLTSLVRETHL